LDEVLIQHLLDFQVIQVIWYSDITLVFVSSAKEFDTMDRHETQKYIHSLAVFTEKLGKLLLISDRAYWLFTHHEMNTIFQHR